jgi:hypothetical protein
MIYHLGVAEAGVEAEVDIEEGVLLRLEVSVEATEDVVGHNLQR